MNTASLELCKELHELSGWSDTELIWRLHKPSLQSEVKSREEQRYDNHRFRNSREADRYREENAFCPAYTLGYLLRKLPVEVEIRGHYESFNLDFYGGLWSARYGMMAMPTRGPEGRADTPEDAVCKLSIELFKQGIIKKDE